MSFFFWAEEEMVISSSSFEIIPIPPSEKSRAAIEGE